MFATSPSQTDGIFCPRISHCLRDSLGVKIDHLEDGRVYLSQPHLIESILSDLRLNSTSIATKGTPAASSKLRRRGTNSSPFDGHFNYRSVIGKLLHLTVTRMDIAFAVNQSARFSADPKIEHGKAVNWTGRYLAGMKDKGIIIRPERKASKSTWIPPLQGTGTRMTPNGIKTGPEPEPDASSLMQVVQSIGNPN